MTERWVSQPKHFCNYCKIWAQGDPVSIKLHEQGKNHQVNVKQYLIDQRKQKLENADQTNELQRTLAGIEAAAREQVARDFAGSVPPPPPPPPPAPAPPPNGPSAPTNYPRDGRSMSTGNAGVPPTHLISSADVALTNRTSRWDVPSSNTDLAKTAPETSAARSDVNRGDTTAQVHSAVHASTDVRRTHSDDPTTQGSDSPASVAAAAPIDEATGIGGWTTVAVRSENDLAKEEEAYKLERLGAGARASRKRERANSEDQAGSTDQQLGRAPGKDDGDNDDGGDDAYRSFNPFGGKYRGIDLDVGDAASAQEVQPERQTNGSSMPAAAGSIEFKKRMVKPGQKLRKRGPDDDKY